MILNSSDALARPDGFVGALYAVEGIQDAATLLNGPTGCKIFLSCTAEQQNRREHDYDEMRHAEEFFFQQHRVPCTYLDDYDFVFGASQKLEYVFSRIAEKGYNLIGVLNSPGAALIGDDLDRYIEWSGISTPTMVIEKPDFTRNFEAGWLTAVRNTLEVLDPAPVEIKKKCVNLIGMSIWHKDWEGSIENLAELLELCGITVHTTICAGCSVDELRNLRCAEYNVILHDEMGRELGLWLEDRYGMPMVRSSEGAPFGFDALESWLMQVTESIGVDPSPAMERIAKYKTRVCEKLMEFNLQTGLPKGATFGVCLEASLALPVVKWFHSYLGMVPMAVQVPDEEEPLADTLQQYLADIGSADAWNAKLDDASPPHAMVSDDAVVMRMSSERKLKAGIVLAMPDVDTTHFLYRSVLGAEGPLWVLEELTAGLWSLVESVPGG